MDSLRLSYKTICGGLCTLLLLLAISATAQPSRLKVFFIGNSFTSNNDMPVIASTIAKSMGDTLEYDSHTPGGYSLDLHSADVITNSKLAFGKWNYVIIQEQSQKPAYPDAQVKTDVYPYARKLDSAMRSLNPCGRTVFYMTWGFPAGDGINCPTFPPVCTYEGMDSLIRLRYENMTDSNQALLAPVGVVFRQILSTSGVNVFAPDGMHPSEAGSYAAALTFYTLLFRKSPKSVAYNFTLSLMEANVIKNAVEIVVYNDLAKWRVGDYDPKAGFLYTQTASTVDFDATISTGISNYKWYFGDGDSSTLPNPTHIYKTIGTFNVTLYGDNCLLADTAKDVINVTTLSVQEPTRKNALKLFPNPADNVLQLELPGGITLQKASLTISNLLGQELIHIDGYNNRPIDVSNLSKGMYILNLQSGGELLTQKFLKE